MAPPTSPAVRIKPVGTADRDGDGWRTSWRVVNEDALAVRVTGATAPHSQFRGATSLDLAVRAGDLKLAQQMTADVARAALPDFFFHQRGG